MSVSIKTGPTTASAISLPEGNIARGDRGVIVSDDAAASAGVALFIRATELRDSGEADKAKELANLASALLTAATSPNDRLLPEVR